jgi:predicted ester cyclase
MNEFQLIDQYVRALRQNPTAAPPPGLSPEAAAFVRKIALARQIIPRADVQARVWRQVLANIQTDRSTRDASRDPRPGSWTLHSNGKYEENNPMQTTLTRPTTLSRVSRRTVHPRFIRLAVAMIAVVLLAAILLPGIARDTSPNGPAVVYLPSAANQVTFERYIDEAWNAGNTAVLNDILTADHVCHEPGTPDIEGIDGLAAMIANYRTAFPDWHFAIESFTATDDGVWARLTGTGTHDGPFALPDEAVLEASGNAVTVEVLLNARFVDGKIAEQWMQLDLLGLMQQLEVAPSVGELATEARNLEVARRVIDDLWNGTNLDSAEELYHPTWSYFFPAGTDMKTPRTWDAWREMYEALHRTFPDLQVTVEGMYAEGDVVVVRYTAQGTLENGYATAAGNSMPATGEMISWDGVFLYRMEDGQIIEEWWFWDNETTGAIDYCR